VRRCGRRRRWQGSKYRWHKLWHLAILSRGAIGDAAGTGADVGDLQAFAGERLFTAGAAFTDGEAVEGDFDDVFRLGAGNQNIAGVTSNSKPQNSCLPVRCCVGSPILRRAISAK